VETERHAFLISEIDEGESLLYVSALLCPEMNPRHLLYKRLKYSRTSLDMEKRKFSASTGIQTSVVAIILADWTIPVHETIVKGLLISLTCLNVSA
jgi:hypothetical protein